MANSNSSIDLNTARNTNAERRNSESVARKLPTLAPKPLPIRSLPKVPTKTTPSRRTLPTCPVCLKRGCRLLTHKAFSTASLPESVATGSGTASRRLSNPGFNSSYAVTLCQQHTSPSPSSPDAVPQYKLPVQPEFNTPDMHLLFHSLISIEAQRVFRIPRPPEMASDIICSPFLMPAMQDPILCLSILATAAAVIPSSAGLPARNVNSLTLVGEAMQRLREKIDADPEHISDSTIAAATFLWAVNAWFEDADAMKSHGASVLAFVASRGGLMNLGLVGAIEALIRWVDILHAMIFSTPCKFQDYPEPKVWPFRPPSRYGSFWTSYKVSIAAALDARVAVSCQETCVVIEVLEEMNTQNTNAREYMCVMQKLSYIHAYESVLRAKHHKRGTLDECVCLASSLIKIQCFYGGTHLRMLTDRHVTLLTNAIQATGGPSFWEKDLDLLIWLLFVVTIVPENSKEKVWCSKLLGQAITTKFGSKRHMPANWQRILKGNLERFIWSDLRFRLTFETICHDFARAQNIVSEYGYNDDEESEEI